MTSTFDVVLVLGGGNALGAFQAGVYEALHRHDIRPGWVIGTSIGAVNGALLVGTPPDRRIDALRDFWRPGSLAPWTFSTETARRTAAASWTAAMGRAGIFGPLLSAMPWWATDRPSLFDTHPLADSLARCVDFDLLNDGPCRFTATAVDLESGDDVVFDNRRDRIGPDHLRASGALPIAFPPITIDGRPLVDGGLSANLPLDPVLADPPPRATLCIAVDLLPLQGPVPVTLGDTANRLQDLIFAAQSRRTVARWRDAHAGRNDVRLSLLRLAYTDQGEEVAGKALDFSGPTIERRWAAGYRAGMTAIDRLRAGTLPVDATGLTVVDADAP